MRRGDVRPTDQHPCMHGDPRPAARARAAWPPRTVTMANERACMQSSDHRVRCLATWLAKLRSDWKII